MSKINSYKDLLIWQKGIALVVRIYKLVEVFPQEELYALTSQLKRAAVSISSNMRKVMVEIQITIYLMKYYY